MSNRRAGAAPKRTGCTVEFSAEATAAANDYDLSGHAFLSRHIAFVNSKVAPIELRASGVAGMISAIWQQVEYAGVADEVSKLLRGFAIRRLPDVGGE